MTLIFPVSVSVFLSTPSARRATPLEPAVLQLPLISIHALRKEGDVENYSLRYEDMHFYPRPPQGGRHKPSAEDLHGVYISIHALREEGDSKNRDKISIFKQIIQHSARI